MGTVKRQLSGLLLATSILLNASGLAFAAGKVINLTPIDSPSNYGSAYGQSVYSPATAPSTVSPAYSGNYSQPSYGSYSSTSTANNSTPYTSAPTTSTTYNTASSLPPLRGRLSTIPQGTLMMIRLDQPLNSGANRVGDPITGVLENDVFVNDSITAPAGTQIIGQVAESNRAGRMGKHGQIDVRFVSMKTPDGTVVPIRAHMVTHDDTGILRGDTYGMDIAKGVGWAVGGTAVGAVGGTAIGGLIGAAGAGAAFGTGVGALGGIGYALARTGKNVELPAGTRLSITNDQPISLNGSN